MLPVLANFSAKIDESSNLVIEGYDLGEFVKPHWGDSDYEYWLTISAEYKDILLLWLLKERFTGSGERFANDSEF